MSAHPPVAIIGLGLIGGSLAMRLRSADIAVRGYDTSTEISRAASAHQITPYRDLPRLLQSLPDDAIVVLATPLDQALELLPSVASQTPEGVTITDVVSVKGPMHDAARRAGIAHRYVGAHPMAGTAESGFAAARAGLLHEATWVVTIDDDTDINRWAHVCRLALTAGGRVVPSDSEWHDHAAAWISHLPHVLAELLAANVEPRSLAGALAAGSFRDATRVAATRPELVEAMLVGNRRMLTETLASFGEQLEQATLGVRDAEVTDLVRRGHEHRTMWESRRNGSAHREQVVITLDSVDARNRLRDVGAVGGFIVSSDTDTVTALT